MKLLPIDTLTGYARTAVDLRARMSGYHPQRQRHALPAETLAVDTSVSGVVGTEPLGSWAATSGSARGPDVP